MKQTLTLADWAKRQDPEGKVDKIAEILNETNEILEDMTFAEGNLPTGHKTTIRSGLPEPTWRKLNYGVQPKKSTTVQVTDTCGMLENYAETDKRLADLNGNTSEFRMSEEKPFIEGMNQEMARTIFYGDSSKEGEKFMGFAPRYSQLSGAENSENVINAGGAGSNNTSIYLVVWGDTTVHGIFPKGSKAGLSMEDKGQVTLQDANGGNYEGYRSHYSWDSGLTVRDWRYVVRICNIDVTALTKDASAGADLIDLMTDAIELIPNLGAGKAVFYCNKTIRSFLRKQIRNAKNVNLSMEEVAGKKVVHFDEVPVRRVDALLNTEEAVS